MILGKKLDFTIRKANSFFLRIILSIVLLFIYRINTNLLEYYIYLIGYIAYLGFMIGQVFICPKKYRGQYRLILDLSLIVLFLYGKNLNFTLNFLPHIILITNIINYSNENNRYLLSGFIFHFSIFLIDGFSVIYFHHCLPIVLYFFIISFNFRKTFQEINNRIISLTGELFVKNLSKNNNHKIIRIVKDEMNKNFIVGGTIKDIYLFKIINNKLVLVKGSNFTKEIPYFDREYSNQIRASKGRLLRNKKPISFDDITYPHSLWLKNSFESNEYVFLICMEKQVNFVYENLLLGLVPVFNQISRIFYLTYSLDMMRNSESKIIKEKVTYVLDAKNAMHYVKNKLTPITNILSLTNRYFTDHELDQRQKDYIVSRIKENKTASLKLILNKAELLIRGVDNLIDKDDEILSCKSFIELLRKNWLYHFNDLQDIKINIDEINSIKLRVNIELLEYIFTDIIENIHKYYQLDKCVIFSIEKNTLQVEFINDIKNYEKVIPTLEEIVDSYNKADNDQIHSRQTHGLNFIRRLMRKKRIVNTLHINYQKKSFNFKLNFDIT